jgi:hypothetical protein
MFAPRFYPARFFPRRYFPGTAGPWVDLAVPRFRVEDAQDGTGTVTIAHASDGTTNTLWAWKFGAGVAGIAPASLGNRTGNGTLTITPEQGRYQGYVKSTKAGTSGRSVSEIVGFVISDSLGGVDDELYYRCMLWAQSEIIALGLLHLDGDNTLIMKLPWRAVKQLGPGGVLITPTNEIVAPRDNLRYEIGYRVQITTVRATNQALNEPNRLDVAWRRQIEHWFSEQAPASLTQVKRTLVQPGPIILPAGFQSQYDVGAFVLTFYANRSRA